MRRTTPRTVSVIVPVLNGEEQIEHQLAALAGQTYRGDWEVLVVDNGCSDRSIEIARRFEGVLPALRVVDASGRRGLNHARNAGARAARGDFLAYCDADDVATPGWLAALAEAAPNGDLIGGAFDHEALNGPRARALYPWEPPAGLPSDYGFLAHASGGNCGVWAEVARAVAWDEDFTFGSSDVEFSWRVQLASLRMHYAGEAVMQVRFKTRLRELARQYYAYGRSDPLLVRRFREHGLPDLEGPLAVWSWGRLLRRLPDLAGPLELRARWVRKAARRCGRAAGALRRWNVRARRRPRRAARRQGLRLLEVALEWPPETFIQQKLVELAARGVDVTVTSTVPRRSAHAQLPGVRLQGVPHWEEPRARRYAGLLLDGLSLVLRNPRRFRALVEAVRRPQPPATEATPWRSAARLLRQFLRLAHLKPDVVHFEWYTAAIHHLPLFDVWGCPVVVSCRSSLDLYSHSPDNCRIPAGLPLLFARAAAVHCVCDSIVEQGPRFGMDPGTAWVIRAAVDPDFFHPPPAARNGDEPLRVVTNARLFWAKGHEYALQAVRLLLDRGVAVHLDVVGDGPERDRISGTVDDLDLAEHVDLHGRLQLTEVRRRLHEAHVLLQPSMVEGISNSVLEGMACELPVVVTDCGGMREAVTDGREGFVVAPRDPQAIVHAIERLAGDPGLRAEMGAAGRTRVTSEFTVARQMERTIAMYESVTAR